MSRTRRRPSGAAWSVLLGLLVVPALALGAWTLVAQQPDRTATARPVGPVVVTPERYDRVPEAQRALTFERADGVELRVEAQGLVTRAPRAGAAPKPGATVLEIDGRPVVAYDGPTPLWRSLVPGDKGKDVAELQRWLARAGYDAGEPDGSFGRSLRAAVVAFNSATGRGKVASFDPAAVVWTGSEAPRLAAAAVAVGDRVSPGTVVARGPVRVVAATLSAAEDARPSAVDGVDAQIVLGDVSVPVPAGARRVTDADDLAALVAAAHDAETAAVVLRAAESQPVLAVPATAVVQARDGSRCVFPDATGAPVRIEALGGGLASVQLDVSTPLVTVLVNPSDVRGGESCAS